MERITPQEAENIYLNTSTSIGKRIKEERRKRGLTQSELAFFVLSQPAAISLAERGINKYSKQSAQSVFLLYKIAFVFKISITDLIK